MSIQTKTTESPKLVGLRHLAELNDRDAQYKIGKALFHGVGVDLDCAVGVNYLLKAADQGHAQAQQLLGKAYHSGVGVDKNYGEATRWYNLAIGERV